MTQESLVERLRANLERVRGAIADACRRGGRDPADVQLVAVTKYVEMDVIRTLAACGLVDLGESRVQQLVARAGEMTGSGGAVPTWHMIGHLQRNKVRQLLPHCRIVHSLDSLRLAEEIDACAGRMGVTVEAYLEVNVSGEGSKEGISPVDAPALLEAVGRLRNIALRGLMTMAPLDDNAERARPYFSRLRELLAAMQRSGAAPESCTGLSMGMSQDYTVAVQEGATVVRIGSSLFEGL